MKIDAPISVISLYDAHRHALTPKKLQWKGREYSITQFGYHHKVRIGKTLMHIFTVATDTLCFKLRLDTDTLDWILEEVYEASAS